MNILETVLSRALADAGVVDGASHPDELAADLLRDERLRIGLNIDDVTRPRSIPSPAAASRVLNELSFG